MPFLLQLLPILLLHLLALTSYDLQLFGHQHPPWRLPYWL
jgi:hypothetical protein